MFSKVFVSILAIACLAEMVTACAPSSSPSSESSKGSTGAAATTVASGRKRREASSNSATIELHSNVPVSNVGLLLHKLQNAASNADLDASKFSKVEHKVSAASDGTTIVTLTVHDVNDCASLRQNTQKIVKQVSEVTSASISCGGNNYNV